MIAGITLKQKMTVFCLLIGMLPLVGMGYYAYGTAAQSLEDKAYAQLVSIREVKRHAAQEMIGTWRSDIREFAASRLAADSLSAFIAFANGYGGMKGDAVDVESRWYAPLHADATDIFGSYVTDKGYYDAFLTDLEGRILFSVARESDLGMNLTKGPLATSGIARAWQKARQSNAGSAGDVGFADFSPYAPSAGAPAAFIAAPVRYEGEMTGVAILQIPLDRLNALMQLRAGLGETGETYLVGPDLLMRSDSYLDPEHHGVVASFRNPEKGKVDTTASREALAGNADTGIIVDYNGNPVLSSYAPIPVEDTRWALIAEVDEAEAFATITHLRNALLMAGGAVLAVVLAATLAVLRTQLLVPMDRIRAYAEKVAGGDLDAKAQGPFNVEIAALQHAIATMVRNLKLQMAEAHDKGEEAARQAEQAREALAQAQEQQARIAGLVERMHSTAGQARTISERVSSAADELAAQVDQVNAGSVVQRNRMQETASAMEQINATVMEVARNSANAAESSGSARDRAEHGASVVNQVIAAISQVNHTADTLRTDMTDLGQQADSIGQVLNVISDIADQTNLLALNAAIEAARAGDAGRGFAVVADEVRKLAEKTMAATREVGERIHSIQAATSRNMVNVEQAVNAVAAANERANDSGQALAAIVDLAETTAGQISGIATAAEEQSAAMEQISRAIDEVSTIIHETTEGMAQAAQAVQELAGQAGELRSVIHALEASDS